jgi:hypothetical protein
MRKVLHKTGISVYRTRTQDGRLKNIQNDKGSLQSSRQITGTVERHVENVVFSHVNKYCCI